MDHRKKTDHTGPKALKYLKERGLKEFMAHASEIIRDRRFDYQKWIREQRITSVRAGYQKNIRLSRMPQVYVLVPDAGYGIDEKETASLRSETIRCVKASTYPKVQVVQAIHSQMKDEDYLTFVHAGGLVERHAVFEMVQAVQGGADAVYTDSDSFEKMDGGIRYDAPLFKPDYNPDYLRSCNYIGGLFMVRIGIIRSFYQAGGKELIPTMANLPDPAYCYALTLRCSLRAEAMGGVAHVAKVLYHARKHEKLSEAALQKITEGMRGVLLDDMKEQGLGGRIEDGPLPLTFHTAYDIPAEDGRMPLVSIVIPNKDQADVLENCILSIRRRSTYTQYEIVVVENNSTQEETFALYAQLEEKQEARIVRYPHVFHFSRVINEGVRQAKGDYLILMNNDVTVQTPDWIERLLAQAARPGIGAAGPKLLYPDGRVQSAGIVTGLMGYAGSMMVAEDGDDPGYMGRACLTQDMSAVTAACMMVRRDAFERAGGFPDEFGVALGDVDFCLSLNDAGYRVVFEPAAVMIHHESLTRGAEDTGAKKKRFAAERARFRKKRADILRRGDPAYNPNLSRRRCDWSQQT